jgi:hypothetical protein
MILFRERREGRRSPEIERAIDEEKRSSLGSTKREKEKDLFFIEGGRRNLIDRG